MIFFFFLVQTNLIIFNGIKFNNNNNMLTYILQGSKTVKENQGLP